MKHLFFALMVCASAYAAEKTVCKAIKKEGGQCQSTIVLKDGFCRSHSPLSPRCGAPTKAGTPCQWVVKTDGEKCKNHSVNK
jgi:hypothetical protein